MRYYKVTAHKNPAIAVYLHVCDSKYIFFKKKENYLT